MKILSDLKNIKLNLIDNSIELIINESNNIKYNLTESSNNEILADLIDHKAYATTFLFLNENYQLDINKNSFINESNVIDFYKDCEELLNENVKVVTEKGPLLVSIKGYPIYEVENGILRGSGENKILESFKESNKLKDLCDFLQSNNITNPEDEIDKIESYLEDNHLGMATVVPNKIFKVAEFNSNDNAGGYIGEISISTNGTWRYHESDFLEESKDLTKEELQVISKWMKSKGNMSYEEFCKELELAKKGESDKIKINEEGTQVSDIAPKVDQSLGINKPKIVSTKINGLKENLVLRGFLRNELGQYERGNYILCLENDKYIAINKDKLKESL